MANGRCLRQHDQVEEELEAARGHGEGIERDELHHMIFQEGWPGRRGWLSAAHTVLLERGFCHGGWPFLLARLTAFPRSDRSIPAVFIRPSRGRVFFQGF